MKPGRTHDTVRALLRDTAPPTPIESVNWHALHSRIMADAAAFRFPAQRATQAPSWWDLADQWASMALPVGMAAGLIAALALARIGPRPDVRLSVAAAIRGELPVSTVTDRLLGPDAELWFASATLGE
jgi:hypothetical protein